MARYQDEYILGLASLTPEEEKVLRMRFGIREKYDHKKKRGLRTDRRLVTTAPRKKSETI